MVFYEKDIEAMGGGILLEKIIKKGITRNLYQGIMYLKGRQYHIQIYTYRKGKGKIVSVAIPGDREMELDFLRKIYTKAVQNNEGNLLNIIQGRKVTNYLCSLCNVIQAYLIAIHSYRCFTNGVTTERLIIIITCVSLFFISRIMKDRALRL